MYKIYVVNARLIGQGKFTPIKFKSKNKINVLKVLKEKFEVHDSLFLDIAFTQKSILSNIVCLEGGVIGGNDMQTLKPIEEEYSEIFK